MERILKETESDSHQAYLTGENNFRKVIYPEYKANRTQPKPKWLEQLRSHLVVNWGATITDGYEADDALGMDQGIKTETGRIWNTDLPEYDNTVICSIDKDLLMIPGHHYNFVKQVWTVVQPQDALLNFYTSVLVGDAVDNIKGCPGIGKAKAPRILEGCKTEMDMYQSCLKAYTAAYDGDDITGEAQLQLNAKLLWIWRRENDIWQKPVQNVL